MAGTAISSDVLVRELADRVGRGVVRSGGAADAVAAIVPNLIAEPTTPDSVREILRWAAEGRRTVVVRGGGTQLGRGALPGAIDLLLSTTAMNVVEAHRHGDLTATVQAGATISKTNAVLAEHRQWLPLDPPQADRATIGGVVATNESGPRRQRHGAPRDLIIGMTLVRPDGVLAKSGGIVVKNVAGYDLARLLTGSFGCLGVVLNATFKLAPRAEASRTVKVKCPTLDVYGAYTAELIAHGSTPTALELAIPSERMLVRFESVESVVVRQADQAVALALRHGATATVLRDDDETDVWQTHEALVFDHEGTVVKLVIMPSDLSATLAWLNTAARARSLEYKLIGRAGLGVLYFRLTGEVSKQAGFILALRERLPVGRGSAVIQRADAELKTLVDVWGSVGDGFRVMQEVKRRFDPTASLNPSLGPGGL